MRRKTVILIAVVVLAVVAGGSVYALTRDSGGGKSKSESAAAQESLTPPAVPTFTGTGSSTPSTGGHGPPVPEARELPNDKAGGTRWGEISAAGATFRIPWDDREWEVMYDGGSFYSGFAGLPFIRLTHLPTGQARVYSLLTGEVLLCADRSAVLKVPTLDVIADHGQPVECKSQSLTPDERQVFAHARVSGHHEYSGPPDYPVPTIPGLKTTPVPPDWIEPGFTPAAPSATPEATPTGEMTPEPQP